MKFILSYMQIDEKHKYVKIFMNLWMIFEVVAIGIVWDDSKREQIFGQYDFRENAELGYHFLNAQAGIVYSIRYGFLSIFLLALIIYMIVRRVRIRKQCGDEKHNLSKLIIAKFVIIIPLIVEMAINSAFEFVPIFSSIAVLLVILSVVEGDIFSILDIVSSAVGNQLFHNKWLEQLNCHFLRKTTLINLQFRSNYDNGST